MKVTNESNNNNWRSSGSGDSLVFAKKFWCRGMKKNKKQKKKERRNPSALQPPESRRQIESGIHQRNLLASSCCCCRRRRSFQSPLTSSQGRRRSPIHPVSPRKRCKPRPLTGRSAVRGRTASLRRSLAATRLPLSPHEEAEAGLIRLSRR